MSADEMTTDPAFDFNKDLADVSNLHTATIAIGCGNVGPWTATLAPGVTVSGPTMGVWPIKLGDQPAARKILEYGKQGEGKVVEDRSAMIEKLLKTSAATTPSGTGGSGVSSVGGKAGATGSSGAAGSGNGSDQGVDAGTTGGGLLHSNDTKSSSGCAVAAGGTSNAALWLLATGLVLAVRRRRLTSRRAV
jgi:MYXO-CTERM domain-containing protein